MARTAFIGQLNTTSGIVTGQGVRQMNEQMSALKGEVAPLVTWIGEGAPVHVGSDWKYEWMIGSARPLTITLTSALTTGDTTLTMSTTDINSVQVGQIIHLIDNEEQVRVTVNTGSAVTITRAYGGTTATNVADATIGHLLLPAMADSDDFPESPKSSDEFTSNYAIQAMFELTETDYRTGQISYLTGREDELDFQYMELMKWAKRLLSNNILYGKSVTPASGGFGNFNGLRSLITTNAVTVTGQISPSDILDALELIYSKDNAEGNDLPITFLMNRNAKRIFNGIMSAFFNRTASVSEKSVNLNVIDRIETDLGTFETMIVPQLKTSEILLVRKDDVSLRPIAVKGMGTGWVEFERDAAHINARKRQKALSWIGTLELLNEKRHGKITGFDTVISEYDGAA